LAVAWAALGGKLGGNAPQQLVRRYYRAVRGVVIGLFEPAAGQVAERLELHRALAFRCRYAV
jgi:hypothetical protein